MIDMIELIYLHLMKSDMISEQCKGRIKFYDYPETGDTSAPYILISPIGAPLPGEFASNKELTTDYIFQIDVRGSDRKQVKALQEEIKRMMELIDFHVIGGTDQYDSDIKIFLDGRRYQGQPYTDEALKHIDKDIAHTE
ncbi:hypothetical protein [Staphylococcus auricularis]|uniref:hypothetical protein n=1 Tax=Staphylococcus auricularis TaxID=29379 RepID=UPI002DBCA153|nr:hypothetical protein [Staphylococcus auricularis]MEB6569081.1 hypothetical protein [Staphylococcus auricularis]